MMSRIRSALILAALLGAGPTARPADLAITVGPGPTTISPEEAALGPDPARGIEHGLILLEECAFDDDYGQATKIQFHRRSKILSNEGRDLANVEILIQPDM